MVLHGCVLDEPSLADLVGFLFFALLREVGLLLLQELRDAFLQIEQLERAAFCPFKTSTSCERRAMGSVMVADCAADAPVDDESASCASGADTLICMLEWVIVGCPVRTSDGERIYCMLRQVERNLPLDFPQLPPAKGRHAADGLHIGASFEDPRVSYPFNTAPPVMPVIDAHRGEVQIHIFLTHITYTQPIQEPIAKPQYTCDSGYTCIPIEGRTCLCPSCSIHWTI